MPDDLPSQPMAANYPRALSAILGDRAWQMFLLLTIAVSLPITSQVFRSSFNDRWVDVVMLGALLLVIGRGLNRLATPERRFWLLWAGAIGCWLVVRLCYIVTPMAWHGTTFDLATDCVYMVFYLLLFLAAQIAPHRAKDSSFCQRQCMLRMIGSTVLVFGLLIYFVLLPGHVKPASYQTWLPSFDLYVALDLMLALTYGVLARSSADRRWSLIYGLLALTAGGWAVVDLLEGLAVTSRVAGLPLPGSQILWQIPGLLLAGAARGRQQLADDTQTTVSLAHALSESRLGSPLLLSAVALPGIHLLLHASGLGDRDLQPQRELLVLVGVILLAALAFAEQRLMHREILAAADRRRAIEQRLRRLTEAAFEGIAVVDGPLISDANAQLAAMFGYRRAALAGMRLGELVVPADRANLDVLLGKARRRPVEIEGLRCNRTTFRVEVRARACETGHEHGCVLAVHDLTERLELEAQVQYAQKIEAIGRLTGGIAHDFNNLLTVVLGRCELLRLDASSEQRVGLDEIKHAAESATALTRQLRVFARRQHPRCERLDLSAVVAATADSMLRRLIAENVVLELELAEESAPVLADRSQIEQLILNLVINAQDAMPEGGLLRLATTILDLEVGVSTFGLTIDSGPCLRLSVSDTGVGIKPETLQRLFEPAFTAKAEGSGFGLAAVYGIVRHCGGAIEVESVAGWGTSFHIYLPLASPGRATLPVAADEVALGHTRGRPERSQPEVLMVVEDEPEINALIATFLEQQGYAVLRAGRPREALELAERYEGTIDLMITDVAMPEISGPALAAAMSQRRPEIKVLFVSGYQAPLGRQLGEAGSTLLLKPFALTELSRVVRSLLGERRAA